MKITEIGEFGFIDSIKTRFEKMIKEGQTGIGDDCAILPYNEKEDYIYTTDLLTEGVHFIKDDISPYDLGYKSLAVNLSDIAAMGGTPIGSFLSIAIPENTEKEYLDTLIDGYEHISKKYKTPLFGGDTTRAESSITINVGVIGVCPKGKEKLRNAATNDDVICTTGTLGDSAGGLKIILNKLKPEDNIREDFTYLLNRHYKPEPKIEEAKFLASCKGVNAMMDISDGISSDLKHIINKHQNAIINLDAIPVSKELATVSMQHGWNPADIAISGGEDYEILFTVHYENYNETAEKFQKKFGKKIFPIGNIIPGDSVIKWYSRGKEIKIKDSGFKHF